jgi:molybdate transport system permease protein
VKQLLAGLVALLLLLTVILLGLPGVALVTRLAPGALLARLTEAPVREALQLSLETSLAATALCALLGLPTAWLLATRKFRGRRLLEVLVDLPMVLPPTVAGVGLLLAFGRAGLAGHALGLFGVSLPFSTLGVVVAQTFVSLPFFVNAAAAGFRAVDPRYLDAAATLRAGPAVQFRRVLVPLAMPSVLAGTAMSWARALGEFGATIAFAGSLPGVTRTMPLAVYAALQGDLESAVALSVLLLVVACILLITLRATLPPGFNAPGQAH